MVGEAMEEEHNAAYTTEQTNAEKVGEAMEEEHDAAYTTEQPNAEKVGEAMEEEHNAAYTTEQPNAEKVGEAMEEEHNAAYTTEQPNAEKVGEAMEEEHNAAYTTEQLTDGGEGGRASEKEKCTGRKCIGDKRQHSEKLAAGTHGGKKCNRRKYRGVQPVPSGRFAAKIREKKTVVQIGTFETEEEAALAYDSRAIRLHGCNAVLNFPERTSDQQKLLGLSKIELWKRTTSYLHSYKGSSSSSSSSSSAKKCNTPELEKPGSKEVDSFTSG